MLITVTSVNNFLNQLGRPRSLEDIMPRLTFKSVNAALAAIISIVLLIGVSILVIYVGKSSYNIVNSTSIDGMKIINSGLIANVNDLIDANMSMIKVPAQSGQARRAIEGDSTEMDTLIKALVKEYGSSGFSVGS